MIVLKNVHVPLTRVDDLRAVCAEKLRCDPQHIHTCTLQRRSIDARKKQDVHFVCTVALTAENEAALVRRCADASFEDKTAPAPIVPVRDVKKDPPVVVGSGPAGLFAALTLAQAGYRPILLERGDPVDERTARVRHFWQTGDLDPESNVPFGEGGAGTFSDGKLNTGTKDARIAQVLNAFVRFGAPDAIRYDALPHIGTDLLCEVVRNLRNEILRLGGSVCFRHRVKDIDLRDGVRSVTCATPDGDVTIPCDALILAVGHSARDVFDMLFRKGVPMAQKPFAVGVRIEHRQHDIDVARYGVFAGHPLLGAAPYKLAAHIGNSGVYSFCMCPGGHVVAAAGEEGGVVTNGMSYAARDGENANAALLVGVNAATFGSDDVLAGVAFQRRIEQAAYGLTGSYRAPCQRVEDFLLDRKTAAFGSVSPTYTAGVCRERITDVLPSAVTDPLKAALPVFARQIAGFDAPDAVLTGPETRSSSPVRILRGDDFRSPSGFYPCGEGAGYAGGIVSAAVDGIRCAQAVLLHP